MSSRCSEGPALLRPVLGDGYGTEIGICVMQVVLVGWRCRQNVLAMRLARSSPRLDEDRQTSSAVKDIGVLHRFYMDVTKHRAKEAK